MTSAHRYKRLFLAGWMAAVSFCAVAQTITLPSERHVADDAFYKSQSILPVYRYATDSIEPYTKFGVDIDTTQPWYSIKQLPNMENCRDTGYTYIYFAGADNEVSQGYILALLGNFRRSGKPVYFYVDRNNDLDFSNDGPPDTLLYAQQSLEITLHNKDLPEATYKLRLSRFNYGENLSYKSLLTNHYRAHSGKKIFTNINYCYRVQRYNCITAHYNSGTDSFTLGIKDMNVNGVYNEACNDLLYVGRYKSQITSDELRYIKPDIRSNVFEWNGKQYSIQGIETTGSYIQIKEEKNGVLANQLEPGKKVPNFHYFNVFNVEHQLKEYRRKPVYVFFWNKESITSEDTAYLNKIHREFGDQIKLITLNHGDEPRMVKIMFYYDHIEWSLGYSTESIGNDFFLEDLPRGYYLGKRRRLINDNIRPADMYKLLHTK